MQKSSPPSRVTEVTGEYGVRDVFRYGISTAKNDLHPMHPLESAEANFAVNREARLFQTLRDTQGLHAPLRLQMERKLTAGIQRLPPLESSRIAFNTLVGADTSLAIEDVLGGLPLSLLLFIPDPLAMVVQEERKWERSAWAHGFRYY